MAVVQNVAGTALGTWSVVDDLTGQLISNHSFFVEAQQAEAGLTAGGGFAVSGGYPVDPAEPGDGAGGGAGVTIAVVQNTSTGDWDVVNAATGSVLSGGHATLSEANDMAAVFQGSGGVVPVTAAQTTEQTAVQAAMEAAGIPWDVTYPEQQFRQYAGQQFHPGLNRLRSAFYGMQEPLMQQYYLGAPQMDQPFGGFGQFMSQRGAGPTQDVPAWNPYGYTAPADAATGWAPSLGGLAQRASAVSGLTPGQFLQYVDPQAGYAGPGIDDPTRGLLGSLTPEQQLWYRRVYGTSEKSEENRLALANMMALQRSPINGVTQPMYGGALGEAITGSLGELYTQLMARDPGTNFLDWYQKRAGATSGIGGFLSRGLTT